MAGGFHYYSTSYDQLIDQLDFAFEKTPPIIIVTHKNQSAQRSDKDHDVDNFGMPMPLKS